MSPAELKTLRESLGLTAQWLADQSGVRLRTVQYWESGERQSVPDDVQALLRCIDAMHQRAAETAVAQVREVAKQAGALPETIELARYRTDAELWNAHPDYRPMPVTCHAAMLARTAQALRAAGISSTIDYAD